ncbi:shikimate kinase [Leucothrix sargassi]|nr:shikimate kinase [Leucothrix sargassi]
MKKILIFGNSGSGKSTLAKKLCDDSGLSHLDLDNLAWLPTMPPERKLLDVSGAEVLAFINANDKWVIEGCYVDLLEIALPHANEMIFMNLPIEFCISNARARPWEAHKYDSKEAQDNNLDMLIDWISQYDKRTDTFSKASHAALYDSFTGNKRMITTNE